MIISPELNDLKIPKILYKYRTNSPWHLKSLFANEIYVPSADEFNDPLDARLRFRIREEDLTQENLFKHYYNTIQNKFPNNPAEKYHEYATELSKRNLHSDPKHLLESDNRVHAEILQKFGIFCLTPQYDNFLMWSYYSDSHRGFAIGYDSKILFETNIFTEGGFVNYSGSIPKFPLSVTKSDRPFTELIFTKSNIWQHENEYRFLDFADENRIKINTIPALAVSEIILGCNFPPSEKESFVNKIKLNFSVIKIYHMEIVFNTFFIEKVLIYDSSMDDQSNY